MKTIKWIVLAACAVGLVALAGCGERPQVVSYHQGKYAGKPDTLPWNNAPLAYGDAKWKQGDEKSWQDELRQRAQAQNEYVRIDH